MSLLVFAEQRGGQFRRAAFEAVRAGATLAARLQVPWQVCAVGERIADAAAELGAYGAETVRVAEGPAFAAYRGEAWSAAVAACATEAGASTVLLAASSLGKDLGPQVAARLDAGFCGDCLALEVADGALEVVRPVYAGKARQRIRANGAPLVCTLRPNVFAAGTPDAARRAKVAPFAAPAVEARSRVVDVQAAQGRALDLTEAPIIVSGGRGMKGPEHYVILEELAKVIGGVVGASRAAVDAGWRPHGDQVGQTGKTVSPNLYIACGISGAIQHLAGMRTSKVIVAINKDPEAPIFKVADYGIVGDLFEVVPALTAELRARQG